MAWRRFDPTGLATPVGEGAEDVGGTKKEVITIDGKEFLLERPRVRMSL